MSVTFPASGKKRLPHQACDMTSMIPNHEMSSLDFRLDFTKLRPKSDLVMPLSTSPSARDQRKKLMHKERTLDWYINIFLNFDIYGKLLRIQL